MACSLNIGLKPSGSNDITLGSREFRFCPSICCQKMGESKPKYFLYSKNDFIGKPLVSSNEKGIRQRSTKVLCDFSVNAKASIFASRPLRWWEKTLKPNMVEIHSAQELVDSLLNAGDRLVVVEFYSPGCGGCRALHPKVEKKNISSSNQNFLWEFEDFYCSFYLICQLAESNQKAIFLKVNYEELKTMFHALHIHVLPFFRLYRGAEGRLCSFSCTNATIKKLKDTLAKYSTDQLNLAPAEGLEDSEILKLASIGELPVDFPATKEKKVSNLFIKDPDFPAPRCRAGHVMELKEETVIL